MEDLVRQLIFFAAPPNESLKSSDFFGSVENLQEKMIDIFRYTTLKYVPPFLNGMLEAINADACSKDKRKRFAAAICVTTLINLFPFDDYVVQYRPVIEKLLVPGYRPIVQIGALALRRLTRISGPNRDNFIHELIDSTRPALISNSNPDAKFAAATVWNEISLSSPEFLYLPESHFQDSVSAGLLDSIPAVSKLLINTFRDMFSSEAASIGATFLNQMHDYFIHLVAERFPVAKTPNESLVYLQILSALLRVRPLITNDFAKYIFKPLVTCMKSANLELAMYAMDCIIYIQKIKAYQVNSDTLDMMLTILIKNATRYPQNIEVLLCKIIKHFHEIFKQPEYNNFLVENINDICTELPKDVGPMMAFKMIIALITSSPEVTDISLYLNNLIKIMEYSAIPVPLHKALKSLNETHPEWSDNILYFKNQIIHILRQILSTPEMRTDKILISLKALIQIPNISYSDAVELNSFVLKHRKSKDIEVRQCIVQTSIHLFAHYPENIPFKTIIKLVKFALDDPIRSVRNKSVKAFKPISYKYLSQPDVFAEFSRLIYDDSAEVRNEALNIVKGLPSIDTALCRHLIVGSLKQMNINLGIVLPETSPVWVVFPHVIMASEPVLHLYAETIFNLFYEILVKQYKESAIKEKSLNYLNSAILKEIDESLIKSLTKLYLICPDIVPIKPILNIFSTILKSSVHPWTKENVLKSLKNLTAKVAVAEIKPTIMPVLLSMLHQKQSLKLVNKALKVLGSIGVIDITPALVKEPLQFKSFMADPVHRRLAFLQEFLTYLNELFESVNIDTTRESIVKAISEIYKLETNAIPQYIGPFMELYLHFIQQSQSEKMSIFLMYLAHIIKSAGHLILPFTEKVFKAVENHWQADYTREASTVLSTLIIATQGQCDSILHLVVSVSFLLTKSKPDVTNCATEIFMIMKAISQCAPSYLPSIVDGIINIINSPNAPACIMVEAFDTLQFIITYVQIDSQVSSIRRCLVSSLSKPQARWRDQAGKILQVLNEPTKKFVMKKEEYREPPQKKIDMTVLKSFLTLPHSTKSHEAFLDWFDNMLTYLISISPSPVIKTVAYLPVYPKFTFKYAFMTNWQTLNEEEQERIGKMLNKIIGMKTIPMSIIKRFLGVIKYATLSEQDLKVNMLSVIERCVSLKLYSKALFFLENSNIQNHELLAKLNLEVGRIEEARAIAFANKSSIKYDIWMGLDEWDLAMQVIATSQEPEKLVCERMKCLVSMDDYDQILQMRNEFAVQNRVVQVQLARYMWSAELYRGDKTEALKYIDKTGGYSVDDCIQKAILLISLNQYEKANMSIHLAWRYLTSSISSLSRNNANCIKTHIFQAEQLHELAKVIDYKVDKEKTDSDTPLLWNIRIQYIRNDPKKQEELFKIRSFIPDVIDLNDYAYHILKCTHRMGRSIDRLVDLFFTPQDTENKKFCKLCFSKPSTSNLNQARKMINNCSNTLRPRLGNYIGMLSYKYAKNENDLREALKFIKNKSLFANTLLLITYITRDEKTASDAADALKRCIDFNKRISLSLHQLCALLISFPESKSLSTFIRIIFEEIPINLLRGIRYSSVLTLLHSSKNVTNVFKTVVTNIISNIPQSIAFEILNQTIKNPDSKIINDLNYKIQTSNAISYSQIAFIQEKLTNITHTAYDQIVEALTLCLENLKDNKKEEAMTYLKKVEPILKTKVMSQYDSIFMNNFKPEMMKILIPIIQRGSLEEKDFNSMSAFLLSMIKKQDSIRVLPITMIEPKLESKNNWTLQVLGKDDKENLRIAKFFHSMQRMEIGTKISIIANNGKKYNYYLIRRNSNNERIQQSDQFLHLLNSVIHYSLAHRAIIQLAPQVILVEILKGHVSLYDLVALYNKSKSRESDNNFFSLTQDLYDSFDHAKRVRKINHLSKKEDVNDLKKAILVTSKSPNAWIRRSSTFSKSMGALSALSYLIGNVRTGPDEIMYNKTTGAVTFTHFLVTAETPPVPFRLTPMITAALGSCGVEGPFKVELENILATTKKLSSQMAPCLQFAINSYPFDPSSFPSAFLRPYGFADAHKGNLDLFYERFNIPANKTVQEEVNALITKATSPEQIARMPGNWFPWW